MDLQHIRVLVKGEIEIIMALTINDYKTYFKENGYILLTPAEINVIQRYINSVFDACLSSDNEYRAGVGQDLAVVMDTILELNGQESGKDVFVKEIL